MVPDESEEEEEEDDGDDQVGLKASSCKELARSTTRKGVQGGLSRRRERSSRGRKASERGFIFGCSWCQEPGRKRVRRRGLSWVTSKRPCISLAILALGADVSAVHTMWSCHLVS